VAPSTAEPLPKAASASVAENIVAAPVAKSGPDNTPAPSSSTAKQELPAKPEPAKPASTDQPAVKGKPRIAIILDDGGGGGPVTEALLLLDKRLTLAIMPKARHAADTAKRATEAGFQVMLHLPMESTKRLAEPGQLEVAMSREEIQKRTEDAIKAVPGAVGVNNHTGSTFTPKEEPMRAFLDVVKKHNWFFVDSWTTGRSKGKALAREMKIPTAARDIFLDYSNDPKELDHVEYIQKQLEQLIKLAERRGAAVGIGHFKKNTVQVLKEMLPELEHRGVKLVHASELVE
jgi:hypothetical protein